VGVIVEGDGGGSERRGSSEVALWSGFTSREWELLTCADREGGL